MEDLPQSKIKDTYKILETIGKGSFSSVKKAKKRATGELFAVKVLSKKKMSEEDRIHLKTEVEILKLLDHPNIVRLIEVYEEEQYYCLVMELLEGGELLEQIVEKGNLTEIKAKEAILPIISAIEYFHDQGIIHRDIKLENILVPHNSDDYSALKVADFGLAKLLNEDLTETQCGSPGYVAPEILNKVPYGKECDLWSIGIVAYIMLCGQPPFFNEDKFALYEEIKNGEPNYNLDLWKEISPEGQDFIQKILVKNPMERMTTKAMLEHPWLKK